MGAPVSADAVCAPPPPPPPESVSAEGVSVEAAGGVQDQCGCPAGTGWSVTTGVGCCKPGSWTQASEVASCQATRGNLNCNPMPSGRG